MESKLFNSIEFSFYFDFVNIYMIEIHHWPTNSKELIEAGQWLQLIYVSSWNSEIQGILIILNYSLIEFNSFYI